VIIHTNARTRWLNCPTSVECLLCIAPCLVQGGVLRDAECVALIDHHLVRVATNGGKAVGPGEALHEGHCEQSRHH
jgi:hypothetical protein